MEKTIIPYADQMDQIIQELWPGLKCSTTTAVCAEDGKIMSQIVVRFNAGISWEMPESVSTQEACVAEVRGKIR